MIISKVFIQFNNQCGLPVQPLRKVLLNSNLLRKSGVEIDHYIEFNVDI